MKSYQWWKKRKKIVQKKYTLLLGRPQKDEIWAFLVAVLNIIEKNLGGD